MSSNWELVISNARLVSLPEAYLQLKQVLDQPDFSMAEVAVPISQDPALTARLLRLVNSSFYGFSGQIDTVFRAVTMIGTQQVYDLALATAVTQTFDGMDNKVIDMSSFWKRSVFCGLAAKNLAKACQVKECERLFVAGLLHDIGHLIMYQSLPELCQQCINQSTNSGAPIHLVERELMGLDYARVGGALMKQWQLPASLRETAEFHLAPEQALLFPLETSLVHIAQKLIVDEIQGVSLSPYPLEITGLSMDQCVQVIQQTEQDVTKVLDSLFPLKNAS